MEGNLRMQPGKPLRHPNPLLGVLGLLAACATAAPPEPPPLPYPPAARERMLRIALAEWREWGSIRVDAATPSPAAAPSPIDVPEADPANFPRILAYWRAVPDDEGAVVRNRVLYAAALAGDPAGAALWRQPFWSAAFVSYVLRGAGVDAVEFPAAAAHATYVDALIRAALRFPATAPFIPFTPAERAPLPGDLLCADRGPEPIADWRARAADTGRFRPMHCDIVVTAGPGAVEAIGGNVRDAVTRTRFPADGSGYLLPALPGAPVWFAVFENRLGRLPPWDNATSGIPPS